ncbi:MAG: hypothetical protein D6751_00045, partial [Deltaproteobacteria bacterium]
MTAKKSRLILVVVIILAVIAFFAFDLGRYFTLDYLKARQATFDAYYAEHTARTLAIYFVIYVLVTALSLPGAAVMTLAGGALFGFWS